MPRRRAFFTATGTTANLKALPLCYFVTFVVKVLIFVRQQNLAQEHYLVK
jgi:hypothetical protein